MTYAERVAMFVVGGCACTLCYVAREPDVDVLRPEKYSVNRITLVGWLGWLASLVGMNRKAGGSSVLCRGEQETQKCDKTNSSRTSRSVSNVMLVLEGWLEKLE
jgi:hypothetical protein